MATSASRKARSRETERTAAARLRELYPAAVAVPSALSGVDVLNTPGLAVEVKARRDLNLPAWLRQADKRQGQGLPVVIHRPDGYGPESVGVWPVTMTFDAFMALLKEAGYGGE